MSVSKAIVMAAVEEINKSYENGPVWEFESDGPIEASGLDNDSLYILWDEGYLQGVFTLKELKEYFEYQDYTEFLWISMFEKGGAK